MYRLEAIMRLIKSIDLENYVNRNKKEAENEFPYIIKKLLNNTVKDITGIDVPSGDNTIQTGFDGVLKFVGTNKYLGDKPVNIEIGTDNDYLTKANQDIQKREYNQNENFIFITPYRWNSRKKPKDVWIKEKKQTYKWNDIKIIDAEILENWLEEDFITTKYLLEKLNIKSEDIFSIKEKEEEYIKKTIKGINLDFFDYEDNDYEKLLSELDKEYYNIVAPTKEEGLLVTLYYLKKNNKYSNVLIIDSENAWKKLISYNSLHNAILIPNFYRNEELAIPENNVTIFIHDNEEMIEKSDYSIKERTINNLSKSLEIYYKDEKSQIDYEQIHLIIKKSLGKYMPLKRELFKELNKPGWYNDENAKLYLYLFFVNNFTSKDIELFEKFGVNIIEFKELLSKLIREKDPYVVYYKYRDQYRVVNIHNAIDWLGFILDDDIVEKICNISREVLLYLEPKYMPENINKTYYIENASSRKFSKCVKEGILKGLVITKLYLQKENKYRLVNKINDLIDEYYNYITSEGEYLSFANIADKIVELNYEKYLKKIQESVGNDNFEKMFNLTNKDTLFSSCEYCNILFGIEKSINKKDYVMQAVETLAILCEMKNTEYKNMANTPFNSLEKVFLGWDNLTCLEMPEKIIILEKLIKNHYDLGKRLLIKIFPNESSTWSFFAKPEFDVYDDIKRIKYVQEQRDYFSKYYMLYLENYVKNLSDLSPIYKETHFIELECFEKIKEKTIELIKISNDEEKFELKKIVSEKLRGYKKFHNSHWDLSDKQLEYLTQIEHLLIYENPIYDYICVYKYHTFIDEDDLKKMRQETMELVKQDENNEDFLLARCDNKRDIICDIYEYKHQGRHNVKFLKKLFNDYDCYVQSYLNMIYSNERLDDIFELYNSEELLDIPIDSRIFILSNMGYNEFIYNKIKNKNEEKLYWQKLNIYNGEKNDFVYESCLKYGNYEMCLEIIYEQADKYDEKCLLLETIKNSKVNINQIDEYKIQKIFESFYNYTKINNFERIAKLEIYYGPLLENKTYFLSKEASKSPSIVAELVELIYKDEDGNFAEIENREIVVSNCFTKLHNLKIDFNNNNSLAWCEEFLQIMKEKKRSQVMFHILGQLLARTGIDSEDSMFPIKKVREIIEYYKSDDLASSFGIEKYNQRGVHWIGIGKEELSLYQQYSEWSDKMKFIYPETSKILKNLADTYKNESIVIRDEANYL